MRGLSLSGVSLLAAGSRYRKTIGTLSEVEVLARPAGALLEGLHDHEVLVGPAVELQVRLELAYYPVAATLRCAFRYHHPIVVAYPQRDRSFEGGPVAGYVGRVSYHVAGCLGRLERFLGAVGGQENLGWKDAHRL